MDASIIVPTLDRAVLLKRTLDSLLAQVFPGTYEVLVVDNGSSDSTATVVQQAVERSPGAVRWIFEPIPGLLSGRHRGVREAAAELLIFVDDDIEATSSWLSAIVDAFRDESVQMVGGRSTPLFEAPPPSWLDAFWIEDEEGRRCEWLSLLDLGREPKRIDPNLIWGLNLAIRRKALFDLGGFHPDNIPSHLQRFQGDGETGLTRRAAGRGLVAWYAPAATVKHAIPRERLLPGFFEKRAYYQGVGDSYAFIRERGGASLKSHLGASVRTALRSIPTGRGQEEGLRRRFDAAYWRGYRFHHAEVLTDPALLEWVLRADYWDYQLPVAS